MSKKQWKSVDLSLQFSIKSDWSQEEVDAPQTDVKSIRSSLPTKTNATRQTAELDNIPENGPFILNFANMSFDATETELRHFFREFNICGMELNNPRRGSGHVEFTNINDLAAAWKLNEKPFLNRPFRLSIPLKEDQAREQQITTGTKQRFQQQQKTSTMNSDDSDNWRVKRTQPSVQKESIPPPQSLQSDTKAEESSDWRTRAPAPVPKTESCPTESTAWRTPARPKSNNKSEPRAETNIDEKSNWRSGSTIRDTGVELHSEGGDNWRKSVAGGREEKCVPGEHSSEDSLAPMRTTVIGDGRPMAIVAKASEPITRTNPWTKKSVVTSSSVTTDNKSDTMEWREKRPADTFKNSANTKVIELIVEELPKNPEPQLAPAPQVNVWQERLKCKGTQPMPVLGVMGRQDREDKKCKKEENVDKGEGRRENVEKSEGRKENVEKSEGRKENVDKSEGRKENVDKSEGRKENVEKSEGRKENVEKSEGRRKNEGSEGKEVSTESVRKCEGSKENVWRKEKTKDNMSRSDPKDGNVCETVIASEGGDAGVSGQVDAKTSPRQGAVVISANGPFLDPKNHRSTPPHNVSDTSISIDNVVTVPTAMPSLQSLPLQKNVEKIVVTTPKSSWAQGPPKGLKQSHGGGP